MPMYDDEDALILRFRNLEDIDENIVQLRKWFPNIPEEEFQEVRQWMIERLPSGGADSSAGE